MNRVLILSLGLAAGCPSAPADPPFTPDLERDDVLVVHAPFAGDATVAVVDPATLTISDGLVGLPGSDWVPAAADGTPWLLGRFGLDVARRYPDTAFGAPDLEVSTGAGTNPQDVAQCGGALYVSRYDQGEGGGDVAILDPATGAETGRVDLSAFAESADATPEPTRLHRIDDTVYVALERFDRGAGWVADPEGRVVAIDCASGDLVDSWITGPNPSIEPDGAGFVLRTDMGIERLDPTAGITTVAPDLGGPTELMGVAAGDGVAVAVIERPGAPANEVVCVDLVTAEVTPLTTESARAWSVRSGPDGRVWVLWRDHWATGEIEVGGIAIYDPETCTEVTPAWLVFPSDPFSIAFLGAP